MRCRTLLATSLLATLGACFVPSDAARQSASTTPDVAPVMQAWTPVQPDLAVSQPPFRNLQANWKQRLDQPYVYVDYTGSYIETGKLLPMVQQAMLDQGIQPVGSPFALYYDDPGTTDVSQLRSRACIPVDSIVSPRGELAFDVLPSTTVVYAFAGGAYPDVPQCYPGLFNYMSSMGWVESGPIRESYLVPPGAVDSFEELITEVQIPVSFAQ